MDYIAGDEFMARYMGIQKGHPDKQERRWKDQWFESLVVGGNRLECGIRHRQLKFHDEWGWIMPVVRKINEHGYALEGQALANMVYLQCGTGRLTPVYSSIVVFLEWYYQNEGKNG